MILNSIILENIRSYKKEEIQFPRGITLFEGDIGSGKSSILMAIEFALFGLGSQKPEALLSKKTNESSVQLNFEINGINYEIFRQLKKHKNSVTQGTGYILSNGIREELSPSELKLKVLQILRFNEPSDPRSESRIYRYAVFTPQEEMKEILRGKEKRLETLRKAFAIEDYKTVAENSANLANSIDKKSIVLKERFRNLENDTEECNAAKKQLTDEKTLLRDLASSRNSLKEKKENAETTVRQLMIQKTQKEKLELQLHQIDTEINEKQSAIHRFDGDLKIESKELEENKKEVVSLKNIKKPTQKSVEQLSADIKNARMAAKDLDSVKERIKNSTTSIEKLHKKLGTYKDTTVVVLNKNIKNLQDALRNYQNNFENTKSVKDRQEEKKARLKERVERLESNLFNLKKIGAKCPYCESKLTKKHIENLENERQKELKMKREELRKVHEEIKNTKSKIDDLEEKIENTETTIRELENKIPLVNELTEEIGSLKDMEKKCGILEKRNKIVKEKTFPNDGIYEDAESYLLALKDRLTEFNTAKETIKKLEITNEKIQNKISQIARDKTNVLNKISDLKKLLQQLNNELTTFKDVEDKLNSAQNLVSRYEKEILEIVRKSSALENSVDTFYKRIGELNDKISYAEESRNQYQKFVNYYEWLNGFFIPTIEQIEKQVMLSIQQNFNTTYQNWYYSLIEDPTKESRIDEDFTPLVEQDGYEQEIDYLSGGEKTSIALAYRLTLNSLMRQENESLKSNLLILDEPTDGFSKSQLSKIRSILQQLNSEQIILVSHEKELETYVDNIFYITKDEGISHVLQKN